MVDLHWNHIQYLYIEELMILAIICVSSYCLRLVDSQPKPISFIGNFCSACTSHTHIKKKTMLEWIFSKHKKMDREKENTNNTLCRDSIQSIWYSVYASELQLGIYCKILFLRFVWDFSRRLPSTNTQPETKQNQTRFSKIGWEKPQTFYVFHSLISFVAGNFTRGIL